MTNQIKKTDEIDTLRVESGKKNNIAVSQSGSLQGASKKKPTPQTSIWETIPGKAQPALKNKFLRLLKDYKVKELVRVIEEAIGKGATIYPERPIGKGGEIFYHVIPVDESAAKELIAHFQIKQSVELLYRTEQDTIQRVVAIYEVLPKLADRISMLEQRLEQGSISWYGRLWSKLWPRK